MSFDIDTNKVINDIVSRSGISAILIAKEGSGKKDFLTKLSSFYKKVYWFSPDFDDFDNLVLVMATKVFRDEPEKLLRVKQVLYCRNNFNNDEMIVNYIVDMVAESKNDYMFAFEHLELLPKQYDFSRIERLIRRCPSNLKVVLSAEVLPNIDIKSFGDSFPMIIDDKVLDSSIDEGKVQVFCRTLDGAELQFLKDFRIAPCIDKKYAESVSPIADAILNKLSKYPILLSERDPGIYRMSTQFQWYIDRNIDLTPRYTVEELRSAYCDFAFSRGDYYRAMREYVALKDAAGVNRCIEAMLIDPINIEALCKFSRYTPNQFSSDDCQKYVYVDFYRLTGYFVRGQYEDTIELSRQLKARTTVDNMLYSYCVSAELFALYKLGRYQEVRDRWEEESLWQKFGNEMLYFEDALSTLFKAMIAGDMPINLAKINKFDKIYQDYANDKEIWYVKIREMMSRAYAYIGNNNRAHNILKELENKISCYTIPHNVIFLEFQIDKDAEEIESDILKAIKNAQDNDITKDVSLLYSALARTKEYSGHIDEVLPLHKKAMALDVVNSRVKYQNIAEYIVACAKYQNIERARECADIYLKYVQTYCPKYEYIMHYADAYCLYLQGDLENAYTHAIECIKFARYKSQFWLVSMAMAAAHLMKKRSLENPPEFIENLLKTAKNYGLDRVIVEHNNIFKPLLEYSQHNNICTEYVEQLQLAYYNKEKSKSSATNFAVNLFGTTSSVFRNGQEIAWKTKKAKELFVHYVLAGKEGLDRSYIIDLMWRGYQYESAINNLKTTNNIIRKTLDVAGAKYKLKYINSKYILDIEDCIVDTVLCKELIDKGIEEPSPRKKAMLAERVVREFSGNVAPDMKYPNIELIGAEIKRGKIILLIRTIKGLIRENDCIEARRYLDWLIELDHEGDYSNIKHEIDFRMGQI